MLRINRVPIIYPAALLIPDQTTSPSASLSSVHLVPNPIGASPLFIISSSLFLAGLRLNGLEKQTATQDEMGCRWRSGFLSDKENDLFIFIKRGIKVLSMVLLHSIKSPVCTGRKMLLLCLYCHYEGLSDTRSASITPGDQVAFWLLLRYYWRPST